MQCLKTCNFIKKRLQHRCFLVNIAKILRTPILKKIWERLLSHFSRQKLSFSYVPLTLQKNANKIIILSQPRMNNSTLVLIQIETTVGTIAKILRTPILKKIWERLLSHFSRQKLSFSYVPLTLQKNANKIIILSQPRMNNSTLVLIQIETTVGTTIWLGLGEFHY